MKFPHTAFCSPLSSQSGSGIVIILLLTALLATIVIAFLSTSRIEQIAAKNFTRQNAAAGLAEMATQQAMANIAFGFNLTGNLTDNLSGNLTGNNTGNTTQNYATILTTQPGAIHKYIFQNGSVTRNATVELFSSGNLVIHFAGNDTTSEPLKGNVTINGTANLNNLENPGNTTVNATSNQWTITGNANDRINVPMEEVTDSAGNVVGRIAYYVDDEGTKLNLNAATGDRPTLNVGSSRSLSLSTIANATQSANFTEIINGNFTSNSSIKTWNYFYRPEQIVAALMGNNSTTEPVSITGNLSKFSVAPLVGRDYHIKKTPWGTDRVFINDLPINSTGVNAIYEALSGKNATTGLYHTGDDPDDVPPPPNEYERIGQNLLEIYGTTFAEKYTDAGLKQIAANILQARDPNVLNDWNRSVTYNGSLLGASDMSHPSSSLPVPVGGTQRQMKFIPNEYLGNVPFPILNEIGVTVCAGIIKVYNAKDKEEQLELLLYIRPFISIYNPWPITFPLEAVQDWMIDMQVDSFTFYLDHIPAGSDEIETFQYGPTGYEYGMPYGRNHFHEGSTVCRLINDGKQKLQLQLGGKDKIRPMGSGSIKYLMTGRGGTYGRQGGLDYLPSYKKELTPGEEYQFPCPPFHNKWSGTQDIEYGGFGVKLGIDPKDVKEIIDIYDIIIKFEYIRLVAIGTNDAAPSDHLDTIAATKLRDWMLGEDIEIECWLQAPNPRGWVKGFPANPLLAKGSAPSPGGRQKNRPRALGVSSWETKPPQYSIKRIGGALKPSLAVRPTPSPTPAGNLPESPTASPTPTPTPDPRAAWSKSGPATWISSNASGAVSSKNTPNTTTVNSTLDPEAYPSTTKDNEIPGDPIKTESDLKYAFDPAEHHLDSNDWPKIEFTNPANGTGVFTSPADLGKIQTNIQHRKLRFMTQHPNEIHGAHGGNGNATKSGGAPLSYIPDWAMLDVISFGSNVTSTPAIAPIPAPVNLNGRFHVPPDSPQPSPRTAGLESALKALDSAGALGNSFNANFTVSTNRSQYIGSNGNVSSTVAGNIANLTWSTGNFSSGHASWGKGNATNDAPAPAQTQSRRKAARFPATQFVLPSEVTEIRSVSDVVLMDNYSGNSTHIKANEGRLSALFPGATTQSRFFTIYAFAQALDKLGQPDSEAVTKTLVEVEEIENTTTPPTYTYKVKKLYTQPISVP